MNSHSRGLYLPPAVLNLPALSWPARLVLAEIIALYKVNGQVWANDQHFVNRLPGLAKRTVGGAIKELADDGYLVRDTKQSAQHKRTLTPSTLLQNLLQPVADSAIENSDMLQNLQEPIADSATCLLQILPQPIAESADINYQLNINQEDAQISSASTEGEQAFSSQNPVTTGSPPVEETKSSAVVEAGLNIPFADFWQAYGKKVGRHKSELKWKALTPAERIAASAAVPAVVASRPEIKFRKDPLSWLNGKHWEDELPTIASAPLPTVPTAPASYDPAALFGFDDSLTGEQRLAQHRQTPEYAAWLAREQAREQASQHLTP